ncbi:MAG: sigma-54 dependent transcriptional regulator [Desulfobacteraceae bacterium]|nr:sigma-54 dependent transcriptional regulator [Desulfobacteraceae bacterium]
MDNEISRVLLVDDDPLLREVITSLLAARGYRVDTAGNGVEALDKIKGQVYDHIITDLSMPVMDGLTLLKELKQKGIEASVIVISAHTDMEHVVQAMQLGARDYVAKPFQSEDEILLALQKVEERARLERENIRLRREVEHRYTFSNIVAKSSKVTSIFETIAKIADYKTTVLITGESGTGKELIAKAIHYNSSRRDMPLVGINCGGIPETLLESELFGYVKGAFTDAYRGKKGLFEEANGGTLFLDEIGEMPLSLQVKLLRALQEEEIRPLGDNRVVKLDVRIVAATSKNLRDEVKNERFREDLFYRINVLTIEMPPLRERKEDIPLLVNHFIEKLNRRLNLAIEKVDNDCLERLLEYSWPGNVRELENAIERAMVLSEGKVLTADNLPRELVRVSGNQGGDAFYLTGCSIKRNTKILEKQLIGMALAQTGGNKTKAAALLELSLPALLYKIKEYGVDQ